MMRLAALLVALLPLAASAADGAVAEGEIAHLIAHLGASGCEFNRNGSWHTAERAVAHLNKKYDYLRKRGLVPDAEAFIERAAAESSISGKPYLVKCADGAAVPSAKWLRDELARYRAQRG